MVLGALPPKAISACQFPKPHAQGTRKGTLSLGWESWPKATDEWRNGVDGLRLSCQVSWALCNCLLRSEGALSSQPGHGASLLAGLPLASRSVAYGCQGGGATREGKVAVPRSEARPLLSG